MDEFSAALRVLLDVTTDPDVKDVVFFLGEATIGKTSTCKLLAESGDLSTLRPGNVGGVYVIRDAAGKISSEPGAMTEVVTPYVSKDKRAVFVDTAGYSDDRGLDVEINSMLMTRQAALRVPALKIAFVVEFSRVSPGAGIGTIEHLLEYATGLLVNLDRYLNSIALICTKVPNQPAVGRTMVTVSDEDHRETVRIYLEAVLAHLERRENPNQRCISLVRILLNNYKDRVGLLRSPNQASADIFSIPVHSVRGANDPPAFQFHVYRAALDHMLREKLINVRPEAGDIGYPLSELAANELNKRLRSLEERIREVDIVQSVRDFFIDLIANQTAEETCSLLQQHSQCTLGSCGELETLHGSAPSQDAGEARPSMPSWVTERLCEVCREIPGVAERFDLLREMKRLNDAAGRGVSPLVLAFIEAQNKSIKEFFKGWEEFPELTAHIKDFVWTFKVQKRRKLYDVREFICWKVLYRDDEDSYSSVRPGGSIEITPENDKLYLQVLRGCGFKCFPQLERDGLDPVMRDRLNLLLHNSLRHDPRIDISSDGKVEVTGLCIVLSEIRDHLLKAARKKSCRRVNVFAKYVLFVDCDLDVSGLMWKLAMVSPVCHVVGDVRFNMNGLNGKCPEPAVQGPAKNFCLKSRRLQGTPEFKRYQESLKQFQAEEEKIKEGNETAEKKEKILAQLVYRRDKQLKDIIHLEGQTGHSGVPGLPGKPGGPGGAFFGFADEFVNGKNLTVSVCGGDGGSGQAGGNGGDGQGGADAISAFFSPGAFSSISDPSSVSAVVVSTRKRVWYGFKGGQGGRGGDGGYGGLIGRTGDVNIFTRPDVKSFIRVEGNDGKQGEHGKGGYGGCGGFDGLSYNGELFFFTAIPVYAHHSEHTVRNQDGQTVRSSALSGLRGNDGGNMNEIEEPEEAEPFSQADINSLLLDSVFAMEKDKLSLPRSSLPSDWHTRANRFWSDVESQCCIDLSALFHRDKSSFSSQ